MKAGSALVRGPSASPQLAAEAVKEALSRAGLEQAGGVFLLLSPELARHAQAAVLAATRRAGCLQVFGMVVPGLFTEAGWSLDQPAAAALVLGDGGALRNPVGDEPRLALIGSPTPPGGCLGGPPRHGLLAIDSAVWQQARLCPTPLAEAAVTGGEVVAGLSTGLQRLGGFHTISEAQGYTVRRVGNLSAQDSLLRALPPDLRQRPTLPIHLISAVNADGQPTPLLSANADGSLTFAQVVAVGETIGWGLRQPLSAEAEMRACLSSLATRCPAPAASLMFSCIGRGPLFYGCDDLDLLAFRQQFPGVPLLGAYGSGQIVAQGPRNCQYQNSVVTLLIQTQHV